MYCSVDKVPLTVPVELVGESTSTKSTSLV